MVENLLLKSLPNAIGERLATALHAVQLERSQILHSADKPIAHVYFPLDCMISIVTLLEDGSRIEAATVGSEGVVGLPVFLGLTTADSEAVCQMSGRALRMTSDDFRDAMTQLPELRTALGVYTQALIGMLGQNGACIASHPVEQRLARWLLTVADRVSNDTFSITQEFLAEMLGMHRPTVSIAAGQLQSAGFIKYRHGHVEILDREGLGEVACECYEIVRKLYEENSRKIQANQPPMRRPEA